MSNLVNGFSDIIAAPNLVINGGFIIDQRQLFTTKSPVNVDDFVVDAWKVASKTIDYCEGLHVSGNEPAYRLSGYGKKGQIIKVSNVSHFGNYYSGSKTGGISTSLTASACFENDGGVPLKCTVAPSRFLNDQTTIYQTTCIVKSGDKVTPVTVFDGIVGGADTPYFQIELMSNGNFSVNIFAFREFSGAFRNPPVDGIVPYAEDLARCQRYYQKGLYDGYLPLRYDNTSTTGAYANIPFITEMAGTPTVATTLNALTTFQDASAGNGATTESVGTWTNTAFNIRSGGFKGAVYKAVQLTDRSACAANYNWTAEV